MLRKKIKSEKNKIVFKIDSLNLSYKNEFIRNVIMKNYATLLNSLQVSIHISCKSEILSPPKIQDAELNKFINNYITSNNVINKTFYMILEHDNMAILKSNAKVIEKYLTNMNLYYEKINETHNLDLLDLTSKYVKTNGYYCRTLWVNDWPSSGTDGWLDFLYNLEENIDVNCYIKPQNNYWSTKFLKKKLLQYGVNTSIEDESNGDSDIYDAQIQGILSMLKEIRNNSGKFFIMSFYVTVKGKTLEELRDNFITMKNLLYSKGIQSFGCSFNEHNAIKNNNFDCKDVLSKDYNFTTSSLKTFIPFLSYNICDKNGIYIAKNIANNNLIFLDIFKRDYIVMLILGVMGSGKSFLAKNILANMGQSGTTVDIFDRVAEYESTKNLSSNINVHAKKSMKEYLEILQNYIQQFEDDFNNETTKPRFLFIDEILTYIADAEYGEQFSDLFNKIILQGRKAFVGFGSATQNIDHLSQDLSVGNSLLKNSNVKFLMKSANMNEAKCIAEEFDLNEEQINFLMTAQYEGLMTVNSNCIPFRVETTEERKKIFNTNPYSAK